MYQKCIWDLGCSGGAEKSFTIVSSRREKKHGDGAFMVFPRFKKWHVWENIFPEANSHRNSLGAVQGLVVNIDKKKNLNWQEVNLLGKEEDHQRMMVEDLNLRPHKHHFG